MNTIAANFETKAAFEAFIREYRRPDIGDDANEMTEADFVCDLAEDGWPDYDKWLAIWVYLDQGGELTPKAREQALAYYGCEDDDEVPEQYRLAATDDLLVAAQHVLSEINARIEAQPGGHFVLRGKDPQ